MAIFKSKLLDLKTDFKSLKYSMDRPDGGTSGQPFIKSPIPEYATQEQRDIYALNRTPGPAPLQTVNGVQVPLAASIDFDRVRNFVNSSQGQLFVSKQKELQFTNPKTEVGSQIDNIAINGDVEYTRIFNKGNLLTQVKLSRSGYHFDRAGNLATTPFQAKYEYVVTKHNQSENSNKNRLVFLYNNKIQNNKRLRLSDFTPDSLDTLNNLGVSRQPGVLFEYQGGPNSSPLNPNTVIRRAVDSTTWKDVKLVALPPDTNFKTSEESVEGYINLMDVKNEALAPRLNIILKKYANDSIAPGSPLYTFNLPAGVTQRNSNQILVKRYTDNTLTATENSDTKDIGTTSPINVAKSLSYYQMLTKGRNLDQAISTDFRKTIGKDLPSTENYEGDTGAGYLSTKRGVGNPGSKTIKRTSYSNVGTKDNNLGVDQINALDVGATAELSGYQDMVKCQITAMENSVETDGSLTVVPIPITFRAFVTNLTDSHNATYTPHQYVGRGENFYTYGNSTRKINFNLMIAASSRAEMKPLYRKLNYLVSQLYPGYASTGISTGTGFMRSPLVKVTIGDYIANQPGFFDSISVTVPEDAPWEVKLDPTGVDKDMYQLPQVLSLAITFTPIHDFLARRSYRMNGQYEITPFITPNERAGLDTTKNQFGI